MNVPAREHFQRLRDAYVKAKAAADVANWDIKLFIEDWNRVKQDQALMNSLSAEDRKHFQEIEGVVLKHYNSEETQKTFAGKLERASKDDKDLIKNNDEAARKMAVERAYVVKELALEDAAFAQKHIEIIKDFLKKDKEFARDFLLKQEKILTELIKQDMQLAKQLLSDREFAKELLSKHADISKELIRKDEELAKKLFDQNPSEMKKLMLEDPAFKDEMIKTHPEKIRDLMMQDPNFAANIFESHPTEVKQWLQDNDAFAVKMFSSQPDKIKGLMEGDRAFSDAMCDKYPEEIKKLLLDDPKFADKINPTKLKAMLEKDPNFADQLGEKNPELLKKLMMEDMEFALKMARDVPDLIGRLKNSDGDFAHYLDKNKDLHWAWLDGMKYQSQLKENFYNPDTNIDALDPFMKSKFNMFMRHPGFSKEFHDIRSNPQTAYQNYAKRVAEKTELANQGAKEMIAQHAQARKAYVARRTDSEDKLMQDLEKDPVNNFKGGGGMFMEGASQKLHASIEAGDVYPHEKGFGISGITQDDTVKRLKDTGPVSGTKLIVVASSKEEAASLLKNCQTNGVSVDAIEYREGDKIKRCSLSEFENLQAQAPRTGLGT